MAPREATATPIMPRSLGDMPPAAPAALLLPLLVLPLSRRLLLLLPLPLRLKKEGSSSSSRNRSTTAVWHCMGMAATRGDAGDNEVGPSRAGAKLLDV